MGLSRTRFSLAKLCRATLGKGSSTQPNLTQPNPTPPPTPPPQFNSVSFNSIHFNHPSLLGAIGLFTQNLLKRELWSWSPCGPLLKAWTCVFPYVCSLF